PRLTARVPPSPACVRGPRSVALLSSLPRLRGGWGGGSSGHRRTYPMQSADPSTAPSPHLRVRSDWLARRQEEILEPDLPIVDPHHHLVDRENTGRYLLPDLLADTGTGHNITATVYLEWLSMYRAGGPAERRPVGEVEFANGVAAMAASVADGKAQVC